MVKLSSISLIQLPDQNSALAHRDFTGYHRRLITQRFSRDLRAKRHWDHLGRCFAKRKQQRRLTAAFLLTALTVLTRLTALTADRIDHIDIVDGQAPTRSTSSTMSAVNTVNKVNTVQTHSRPPQAADCPYLLRDQIKVTFFAETRMTQLY